ncbi:hypothetical protein OS493_009598 [Desmophyllum pertusum]|uniref:G-protein coupled receptors family 1 profile domain-containing protein n=1 Tax=Desmophyllum pertusum TaxID=174260 RepID=A0A9X0CNL4_9CNID|nr:hypothetical protein OS493_009598 [Desmophyllum pertusum]
MNCNSSLNASTNATTFTPCIPQSSSTATAGINSFTQISYSITATVAFLGNMLVISIFCRDRKLLKKSYNMLILSLAIADVLTAFLLITNPVFVLGDSFPYPTNHVLGDIFCRVIWSRAFLFQLVVFSAYICMALATERWYAVIKPHKYSETFNRKRTLVYIFLVWLWSVILCCTSMFDVAYVPSNPPNQRCKWQLYWGKQPVRAIVAIIQVLLKMVLPSFTMLFLFIHMVYKTSKSTVASAESRAKMRGKMTQMVGTACIILIICFAPSQTNYALAMAGKVKLDTKLYHTLSLLVFFSSCLNPFIYGLSNKNYRLGFQKMLCPKCSTYIQSTRKIMSRRIETKRSEDSNLEDAVEDRRSAVEEMDTDKLKLEESQM